MNLFRKYGYRFSHNAVVNVFIPQPHDLRMTRPINLEVDKDVTFAFWPTVEEMLQPF
jgi:hypothetical protein